MLEPAQTKRGDEGTNKWQIGASTQTLYLRHNPKSAPYSGIEQCSLAVSHSALAASITKLCADAHGYGSAELMDIRSVSDTEDGEALHPWPAR